jgi:hypothetical protein
MRGAQLDTQDKLNVDGDWITSNDLIELSLDLWFHPTFMVELVLNKLNADGYQTLLTTYQAGI